MRGLVARRRSAAALLVTALAILAAAPASGNPLGPQQRVSHMGPDGNTAFDATEPAAAYNPQTNQTLVVWSGDESTDNEQEIFGRLIDGAGSPVGAQFRISAMGPDGNANFDAFDPAVTYNATSNEYLVVWEGDDNTAPLVDGEVEIFGQRLTAAGAETGPDDFRISAMGPNGNTTFGAFNPAVTHNSQANEYLVAWTGTDNTATVGGQGDAEIYAQRLTATGAATGDDDFRISTTGPEGDARFNAYQPAAAYNTQANEYLVTWTGDASPAPGGGERAYDIFGQRLTAAGTATGTDDFRISALGPDGDVTFGAFDSDIAYNPQDNEYLVVFDGDDDTGSLVDGEPEVYGQRLTANGEETGIDDFRISAMGPDGTAVYVARGPAVAYNTQANEYFVSWWGIDDTAPLALEEREIFGQRLTVTGSETGPDDFRISAMGPDGDASFDAEWPAVAYNSQTNEYLAVWQGDDNTAPLVEGEEEIFARRVLPDADGDGLADSADACVNQSDLAAPRNPRTGCPADPVVSPPPPGGGAIVPAPAISAVSLTPRSPRRKRAARAVLSFSLDKAARVTLNLRRADKGRKVGKRCRRPSRRNRARKRCTRLVKVGRRVVVNGVAGRNRVALRRLVGKKRIKRGRYRLTLATPGAKTATLKFTARR